MKKTVMLAAGAISAVGLMLSTGGVYSHASEKIMDKGQKVNKGAVEKDPKIKEIETLINAGKMIVAEGKKTNDKTMIKNGQLMIKQGQAMKEGK